MRYLVFASYYYYPNAGAKNLRFATNNLVEARHKAYELTHQLNDWDINTGFDMSEVLDIETMKIIYRSDENGDNEVEIDPTRD